MTSGGLYGWIRGSVFTALVVAFAAPQRAAAVDVRPSWECLPPETAVMIRLPRPAEFVETLRTATRFGAVMLRADRLEGLWRLCVDSSRSAGDGPVDWEAALRKYDLSAADLVACCAGDLGAGLVVRPRDGLPPLVMLLAWAEPGEETAGRLLAAVRRRLEEAAGEADGPRPRRIDLELAGHEVVSAIVPVMGIDMRDVDLEGLADESAGGGDARLEDRLRTARRVQTGETHAYHAVLGGRLLYATTLPLAAVGDGSAVAGDFASTSGGDEARDVFASFLAAHAGGGDAALAAVLGEPVLAATAPPGLTLMEVVVVPRRIVAAAGAGADLERGLARVGIDDLGVVAWRQAFDAGRWRSTVAASLPAPRHGALALLDQPCDGCDMPPFVSREVVEFMQVSLDLGRAFAGIRELLLADGDAEQLANMFSVADVQATAWLGADVATLLSGLGSRHWVVSFPPRIGEALRQAREAAAGGGDRIDVPGADRVAVVWQVEDEEPIRRLLDRLAALTGGDVREEQGFRGVRLPGGGAVYVGRGHLVLAVGAGTLDKVLAAIRNPPAGDLSWRESDALRRARQLIDQPPARLFGVSDATRTGGGLGMIRELVAALEPDDVVPAARDSLAAGQKLLPTGAEMEGLFGVGATVLRMTDDGLLLESAWEMPPP